jgi:hypothetical protein
MRDSRYDILFEPVKIGPQIGRRLGTDNGTIAKQRPFLSIGSYCSKRFGIIRTVRGFCST